MKKKAVLIPCILCAAAAFGVYASAQEIAAPQEARPTNSPNVAEEIKSLEEQVIRLIKVILEQLPTNRQQEKNGNDAKTRVTLPKQP